MRYLLYLKRRRRVCAIFLACCAIYLHVETLILFFLHYNFAHNNHRNYIVIIITIGRYMQAAIRTLLSPSSPIRRLMQPMRKQRRDLSNIITLIKIINLIRTSLFECI